MKWIYGLLLCQEHKHIYMCVWYMHAHVDTNKTQHNIHLSLPDGSERICMRWFKEGF